jgi:hypothetical protein
MDETRSGAWIQWWVTLGCVFTTLVIASSLTFAVDKAGASSHPNYPLEKTKLCKSHYVKRTERHLVKGKEVRYVACAYVARPITTTTSTTTSTTTTTTTMPISASVVTSILDQQLLTDYLAIDLSGLPPLPSVDALPGDPVYLDGFVTEQSTNTPSGTMTFSVNGVNIPSCVNIPVQNDGGSPAKSEALCGYEFNTSGSVNVSVNFQGADGSVGSSQNAFNIASPDEVAIIDNECLLTTSITC